MTEEENKARVWQFSVGCHYPAWLGNPGRKESESNKDLLLPGYSGQARVWQREDGVIEGEKKGPSMTGREKKSPSMTGAGVMSLSGLSPFDVITQLDWVI